MQAMWSVNLTELIKDRSSQRMESESSLTKCNYSFDKCNCVQRVIFVMNIYKFWNDRKHIVKYHKFTILFSLNSFLCTYMILFI